MPDFWKNTWFGFSGFDVTKPLRHNDSTIVWTPEIVFPDAAEIEIQAEVNYYHRYFLLVCLISI